MHELVIISRKHALKSFPKDLIFLPLSAITGARLSCQNLLFHVCGHITVEVLVVWHYGVVVRASASESIDVGLIPLPSCTMY